MTAQPDPQLVREIAREAVRYAAAVHGAAFVGPAIAEHAVMEEILASGDKSAYGALCNAARAEVPAAFAEIWPDGQAQAERASDVKPDVCVCGDPNCMPYWRPVHEQMNTMRIRADKASADFTMALLEQVCELGAELDELRARREDGEAERDADVRAVAALLGAITALGPHPAGLERRAEKLRARFAEPIAALDARTTDGGAP